MNTTRMYPRTTLEAFKGPDYANPIEPPEPRYPSFLWVAMAIGFTVAIAAALDWI